MAIYKTAMGKTVDMGALLSKNERVRAVSNAKLNARGDTIDSSGKVIKSATTKVNETYAKTVGNRSAQPVKKVSRPANNSMRSKPGHGVNQIVAPPQLTEEEKELEASFEDDLEVEKLKAKEVNDNGNQTGIRRPQN